MDAIAEMLARAEWIAGPVPADATRRNLATVEIDVRAGLDARKVRAGLGRMRAKHPSQRIFWWEFRDWPRHRFIIRGTVYAVATIREHLADFVVD